MTLFPDKQQSEVAQQPVEQKNLKTELVPEKQFFRVTIHHVRQHRGNQAHERNILFPHLAAGSQPEGKKPQQRTVRVPHRFKKSLNHARIIQLP